MSTAQVAAHSSKLSHVVRGWLNYRDNREQPEGSMTREQIDIWTQAIDRK